MIRDGEGAQVNPEMIVLARESRGLTQTELAKALGMTQGRVSKIEMGLLPVGEEALEAIGRVTYYPRGFFLQPGPLMGVGIAEIFHRKRQDVPLKELHRIHAQIEVRARHIASLLKAAEVPCAVQTIDVEAFERRIEDIADMVRASWGLPRGPIRDLTTALENAGILVIPCQFKNRKVDAISRWVPGLPPLFFVNADCPRDRYRFSLAHELGHTIMHSSPSAELELEADRFAAQFLMPAREIRADLLDLKLTKLPNLKRYWRVSMAALVKRASDIGVLEPNQARYIWMQMSQAGYRSREPVELDVTGEDAVLVRELIDLHLTRLGYAVDELAEMLFLMEDELTEIYLPGAVTRLRLLPPT